MSTGFPNKEHVRQFKSTAVLPYVKGVSGPLYCCLQQQGINTVLKSDTTLRLHLQCISWQIATFIWLFCIFSHTFPSLFIFISVIVSYILFRSLLNEMYWKHTWNMQRYEGNLSIVTLQHAIHRQLVWPVVVEFQMTVSLPVQYLKPYMQLNMVVFQ